MYLTKRFVLLLISIFFVIQFVSCSKKLQKHDLHKSPVVFPAPPDTTRIQFLTRFSTSTDITGQRSSFMQYVLGEEPALSINKPYGITIHKNKIYICDSMLPGLEIVDLKNDTFDYFSPVGLGQLKKPLNCAIDEQGRLYVADAVRKQVVVYDAKGNYLSAIGDGKSEKPTDVLIHDNKIWMCDLDNHQIKVYDLAKQNLLFSFPKVHQSQLQYLYSPTNLDVFEDQIYVTDTGDASVKVFKENGEFVKKVGSFGKRPGQFVRPKGIAVDRKGLIYVVDAAFENVQLFNQDAQMLMFFGGKYKNPGHMWLPAGVTIDYDHLGYFQRYVHDAFDLKYLIFVANQYGPDKINVYGFVEPKR